MTTHQKMKTASSIIALALAIAIARADCLEPRALSDYQIRIVPGIGETQTFARVIPSDNGIVGIAVRGQSDSGIIWEIKTHGYDIGGGQHLLYSVVIAGATAAWRTNWVNLCQPGRWPTVLSIVARAGNATVLSNNVSVLARGGK